MKTSRTTKSPLRLAITSGDRDGIGLEVTCKALSKLGPQSQARFILSCSDDAKASRELKRLKTGGFQSLVVSSRELSLSAACHLISDLRSNEIVVWRDHGNEASWVKASAELALLQRLDGVITGPVSKGRFKKLDRRFMGHTGLLAHLAKTPVQQGYIGDQLAVVLATDHVALKDVEKTLKAKMKSPLGRTPLARAIKNAESLKPLLEARRQKKPIAVLGLNPHAGEAGLIGNFEKGLKLPKGVLGPLPGDTAFTANGRAKYSVVVALYHDQGLIPFKMLHGQDSGFQISLGLPFVRTSVDHGTAQDIFGRGVANPGSMIDAIKGAIALARSRQNR